VKETAMTDQLTSGGDAKPRSLRRRLVWVGLPLLAVAGVGWLLAEAVDRVREASERMH
jgi:hypothetical protein